MFIGYNSERTKSPMPIDLSKFDKPQVLDYAPPPRPRTLREWFIDIPNEALERFGGLTFTMLITGFLLIALGMMIGSDGTIGMKIYFAGFVIVSILFSIWTMK